MTFGIEPFKTKKAKTVQCEGAEISSGDEEEAEDAEETATAKNVLKLLTDFLDSEVRDRSFSSTVMKHLQPVFIFLALFFFFLPKFTFDTILF